MKRLNCFSGKNHFYRANRDLGRIFKTEYILKYMSDKNLRQRKKKANCRLMLNEEDNIKHILHYWLVKLIRAILFVNSIQKIL